MAQIYSSASWSITDDHPLLSRRIGGQWAQEGFAFQLAYGITQLLDLLDKENGLMKLRWEGVEDLDLCYLAYSEYVQVKHGSITKVVLMEVLERFHEVWKEAPNNSRFCIVYPNINGISRPKKPWPQYVKDQNYELSFLDAVEFRAIPDTDQLYDAIRTRLIRRGIVSQHIDFAVKDLKDLFPEKRREILRVDVQSAISKFWQEAPLNEQASALARKSLARFEILKTSSLKNMAIVSRTHLEKGIVKFLESDHRLLILKGLPGSGKTTTLLNIVKTQKTAFIVNYGDVNMSERWFSLFDADFKNYVSSSMESFITFCQKLSIVETSPILMIVDELERSPKPGDVIEQILSDLSGLPKHIKVIVAIRWANFSTQTELRLLSRSDVGLISIGELDESELNGFLEAYELPNELPLGLKHLLITPFLVHLLSKLWDRERTFLNLGDMMKKYVEHLFSENGAEELLLNVVGALVIKRNSYDPISIEEILSEAELQKNKLQLSDINSNNSGSILRVFINNGILTEENKKISTTHDLWIEFLAARSLLAIARSQGIGLHTSQA